MYIVRFTDSHLRQHLIPIGYNIIVIDERLFCKTHRVSTTDNSLGIHISTIYQNQ